MHDYSYLVNQCQSKEQRRFKYQTCIMFGLTVKEAKRYRDWNLSKLSGLLHTRSFTKDIKATSEEIDEYMNQAWNIFKDEINTTERKIHNGEF